MIGQSKTGKSTFFAQDPNVLFIEAEAGLNFLEVFKATARCWEDLRTIYGELKQLEIAGKFPYSIIVIDTIDRIVDFAEEEVVSKAREFYKSMSASINTIGEVPNGAGWSKTKDLVMGFLNKLDELPCALAFIGHLQTKEITDGTRKYHKQTINIGGKLGLELMAFPDHIMFLESSMVGDKLIRIVYSKPTQSKEAGSRGGIIPNGWRWEEDSKKNYEFFRKLFV
jgi:hypothetical protein